MILTLPYFVGKNSLFSPHLASFYLYAFYIRRIICNFAETECFSEIMRIKRSIITYKDVKNPTQTSQAI